MLMTVLLQQLPTLVGVIVGAIATILTTSLGDRTRWKRSQAVRWDQRRLEAYAQYAETIKHLARGFAAGGSWNELDGAADRARERFYLAARRSIGVEGAPVAMKAIDEFVSSQAESHAEPAT